MNKDYNNMSKAKKIAEKHLPDDMLGTRQFNLQKDIEEYTQSQLQELREGLEDMPTDLYSEYGRAGAGMAQEYVLNLIDQLQED